MLGKRLSPPKLILLCACLLAVAGCGTNTEIVNSHAEPDMTVRELEGVLVVGVTRQQKSRVKFEDDMARVLGHKGVRVQVSHALLPQERPTAEEIIAAARSAELDTVLVTRYIDESTEEEYHPGRVYYGVAPAYGLAHYDRFGRYYAHAYEVAYQQQPWTSNVTHALVSDLYVAATGEHLWQAVSETLQAGSTEQVRDDAIKSLVKNLKRQGLLH